MEKFFEVSEKKKQSYKSKLINDILLLNKKYSLLGHTKIKPSHFHTIKNILSLNDKDLKNYYFSWCAFCKETITPTFEVVCEALKIYKNKCNVKQELAELNFRYLSQSDILFTNKTIKYLLKKSLQTSLYTELLSNPQWQKKRLKIMERDNFCCVNCGDDRTTLNVHHKKYITGKKPWEYKDEDLITLCITCHSIIESKKKYHE